jgi:hypothetical protein
MKNTFEYKKICTDYVQKLVVYSRGKYVSFPVSFLALKYVSVPVGRGGGGGY